MEAPVWRRLSRYAAVVGRGVAVAEHPLAAEAAALVLDEGGNAVDAAVAAAFTLSVVLPHLGGLGGDYFALVRTREGRVVFVDGGGPAPRALDRGLLESRGLRGVPRRGPLSPTVPGMVDGLRVMHEALGRLEWARLVGPAAGLAREGFPATRSLARASALAGELLSLTPGSWAYSGVEELGLLRLPGLADALEAVAEDPRSFYEGDIARRIADHLRSLGGVMDYEDLASYRASLGEPLELGVKGPGGPCTAYEAPPPTQGATTLHMIHAGINEGLLDIGPEAPPPPRAGILAAVALAAYRVRDELIGDPEYMDVEPRTLVSGEILGRVAGEAKRLSSELPQPRAPPRRWSLAADTTFYTVADSEGNVVAGIQSLYYHFGSGIAEPRYQVLLNNRASDFNPEPGKPSSLRPGARPLHTLSALILDCSGSVYAVGTSGGHYRPQIHLQLAYNLLVLGLNPGEAVAAPRALFSVPEWKVIVEKPEHRVHFARIGTMTVEPVQYPARAGVAAVLQVRGDGARVAAYDVRGDGSAAVQRREWG